jgi:DNA-binding NarL/FixJ family response regulator
MAGDVKGQGPIHLLVGDSSRIHCDLLAEALKRDDYLRIVGSTSSSHELFEIATNQPPDAVIISANIDDDPLGGIATLREFHEAYPSIPAITLLDSPKSETVLDAFRAGARGIFNKQESVESLCKCVRVVYEGQVWASTREVTFALEALACTPKIRAVNAFGMHLLTKREREVVGCTAEGLTNWEIAARLGLSRHTIKNYLLRIFDKLGVSNRVELLHLTLCQAGLGGCLPADSVPAGGGERVSSPGPRSADPRARDSGAAWDEIQSA